MWCCQRRNESRDSGSKTSQLTMSMLFRKTMTMNLPGCTDLAKRPLHFPASPRPMARLHLLFALVVDLVQAHLPR